MEIAHRTKALASTQDNLSSIIGTHMRGVNWLLQVTHTWAYCSGTSTWNLFIYSLLYSCIYLFIWTQWGGGNVRDPNLEPALLPSNHVQPQHTWNAHPRIAVRVAQQRIINSLKTLWDYFLCVLSCDSVVWSWVWTLQMTMLCWMSKVWMGLKDQVLKFFLRFISLIYICVVCICAWVSLCSPHACGYPKRSEGIWSPGSGGIGGCEPHNVGAGNWPQALWKFGKCPWYLTW